MDNSKASDGDGVFFLALIGKAKIEMNCGGKNA